MVGPVRSESGFTELDSSPPAVRTARGPLGHPAVLAGMGVCVLFGAYALGYMPQFGSLLDAAIRSSRETSLPALGPAFYGIAGLAAFFLLLAVLRSLDLLLRTLRRKSPLAVRPIKPVGQFIEEAEVGSVGVRVAREGYHLLEPHYPHLMCIELTDTLRGDLGLSDEEIRVLDAQLLTRCDRLNNSATEPEAFELVTVFDLLHRVELAPALRAERTSALRDRVTSDQIAYERAVPQRVIRERATDTSPSLPSAPSRNPSSAERKALHAAALRAIESRSFRTAEASGVHRRSSDYEGPRRRITDNREDPVHKGPYRRGSDRPTSQPEERRAEVPTDPAKLNRLDPLFIPPLNQRSSDQRSVAGKVRLPDGAVLTSDRPY